MNHPENKNEETVERREVQHDDEKSGREVADESLGAVTGGAIFIGSQADAWLIYGQGEPVRAKDICDRYVLDKEKTLGKACCENCIYCLSLGTKEYRCVRKLTD